MRIKRTFIRLTVCLIMLANVLSLAAQQFKENEMSYVNVSDPTLFKNSNVIHICPDDLLKNGFCFPLPHNSHLISDWGRDGTSHSGVDIKSFPNDTVRCAFNGTVRMASNFGGYGNVIVVRHDCGLETVYSHNSKNLVKSGDQVKAGQPIALEGRTGRATTEHVHFETRINGQAFNPNWLFDIDNHCLRNNCLEVKKNGDGVTIKVVTAK